MWFQRIVTRKYSVYAAFLLLAGSLSIDATLAQSVVSWNVSAKFHDPSARIIFEGILPPEDPQGGPWWMYALDSPPPSRALSIRFNYLPAGLDLVDSLKQANTQSGYDPNFDKSISYFEETALVWSDYAIGQNFSGGTVEGTIGFMICNNLICLPPDSVTFASTFLESSTPLSSPPLASSSLTGIASLPQSFQIEDLPASDIDSEMSLDLMGFLLLAVGAGLGALLMPCIYPMIPLTVSYFTRHAQGTPIRMALLYGLAIVMTFTGLGVGLSILVGSAGTQIVAANPWVNLIIALAFLSFGLSLLGVLHLRLPSSVVNWFDRKGSQRQDYIGVLFMGLAFTLVSFTCTVPFVGLLLPSIASGEWFYGILGMAMFSITFALPFVAFACFPKAIKSLPGSGGWVREIAVIFGFVEIAAAIKFFSNVDLVWGLGLINRSLAIALWMVLAMMAGLYLIGHLRLSQSRETDPLSAGRLLFGVLFFGIAVYLLPGLFGGRLGKLDAYLPPRGIDTVNLIDSGVQQDWITDDLSSAFSTSVLTDQPLFIDFTGYTCTNCREMEVNVFERGEVSRLLTDHFVLSRLYTDGPDSRQFQTFQENLTGTRGLPTYAIMDGAVIDQPLVQLSGVVSPERFEAFLRYGLERYEN